MGGDETFHVAASIGIRLSRFARQHQFQDLQYVPPDFDVRHVAGMVERDEKLVLEPPCITADRNSDLRSSQILRSASVVFSWQTRHDTS